MNPNTNNEVERLRELCSSLIAKLDHSPYCRLSPKSRPCDCHVSKASAELEALAPAPKQEMPLEDEIVRLQEVGRLNYAEGQQDLTDCLRYLRDEIEQLKKNQK